MPNNRSNAGGYQAAASLSAQAGKVVILHRAGQSILGSVEDVTTPTGVNISTFHVQAGGFELPVIPLEQPAGALRFEITDELIADYYKPPHRLLLAAMYADYCAARHLPLDDYATLNVVWHLEQQGLVVPTPRQVKKVERLIEEVHWGFYAFLRALVGRMQPV